MNQNEIKMFIILTVVGISLFFMGAFMHKVFTMNDINEESFKAGFLYGKQWAEEERTIKEFHEILLTPEACLEYRKLVQP